MKTAIVIPARYGSTRFPGKPLVMIGGQSMLSRVVAVARDDVLDGYDIDVMVSTEDERIADHAAGIGVECVMTPESCATGSDRVLAAVKASGRTYDFILNLQGDAPFTPPALLKGLIDLAKANPDAPVVTPVHALSWAELDGLRKKKQTTPFSGTTAIVSDGRALWFSKAIIPAIRKEDRGVEPSPVYQHIGLYGYRPDALGRFCALPQSRYEILEGLEQLRLIENGIAVHVLETEVAPGSIQSGIDSPEDVARAEEILKARG
ncbi:MAG: 3-deoxy-manno-octulosonate cytidylyltransferase [Alphaproteobacteria bacterium]|nr:3-deoxy-manno-octulosonate cytidylyltransferase [Alphaproteobacteria bacterium]